MNETAGQPIVDVCGVRKIYATGGRNVEALRGADLRIEAPGFHGIMGASGSGKSTLLHLMAGLDRPDSGEIHVLGRAVHAMSERDLTAYRRQTIGIVFQQFNLIPTLSALDNVILPAMLNGESRRSMLSRGAELLDSLGMLDRRTHRPDALSGGEQQRVAIARALLFSPSVLFADEPTGNLDSYNSDQLWKLLKTLAVERDLTVIMVTHEPAAAIYCERVFILKDGVIEGTIDVAEHDAAEFAARYQQFVRTAR